MDIHRKQYANQVYSEIKRIEVSIKRDRDAKKNIVNIGLTTEQLIKKQSELQKGIEEKEQQLQHLQNKKIEYLNGTLDEEIQAELDKNKIVKKEPIVIPTKKFIKQPYIRNTEKDSRYYFRQFCKADETFPDYMRNNLENMPNNKGYIWRGCLFFGKLRAEIGQPYIFFEKLKGGDMNIHEFTKTYHTITFKKKRYY